MCFSVRKWKKALTEINFTKEKHTWFCKAAPAPAPAPAWLVAAASPALWASLVLASSLYSGPVASLNVGAPAASLSAHTCPSYWCSLPGGSLVFRLIASEFGGES